MAMRLKKILIAKIIFNWILRKEYFHYQNWRIYFFSINSSSQVKDAPYEYLGFNIIMTNMVKGSIEIVIKFNGNNDSMSFKLIVTPSNYNVLVSNIYGYQSNELYFLSRALDEDIEIL
ncbi:MAG: hypothetical protein K2I42_01135 [Anaeroplasmataceae bacterium]|nr:hypothetical protein [Anaeroplasmataceae bacterium]